MYHIHVYTMSNFTLLPKIEMLLKVYFEQNISTIVCLSRFVVMSILHMIFTHRNQ